MTRFRKSLLACAAGAALIGMAPASAAPAASEALARAQAQPHPGEAYSQYYRRRHYGGYRHRGGAGLAAGIIGGLAAGALIGGALSAAQAAPPPYAGYGPGAPVGNIYGRDPNWVNYCASRYPDFDPISGTFLGRDGYRYPCR